MKKILYIIFFCWSLNSAFAIETKIVYNIQNEIITSIDIKNEFKYLLALNNKLKDLDKEKIFNISKESIIREKIKKIEVSKYFSNLEINAEYTELLLKNIYTRLNFKTLKEFENYLKLYNLDLKTVRKKITIDALWNELVIRKYSTKIDINEKKLKNDLNNRGKKETKEYNLSEIVYEINNKQEIEKKYYEIKKSITEIGFENSASIYSISETSKVGGNIGWVREQSLNKKVMGIISELPISELSKPIVISNGILILKINEIKKITTKMNFEEELKKLINYERDRQLNQYSKIYFNKVRKNIGLDE
jgi:peptidyl-prolyl cis-trans isomerase SurA